LTGGSCWWSAPKIVTTSAAGTAFKKFGANRAVTSASVGAPEAMVSRTQVMDSSAVGPAGTTGGGAVGPVGPGSTGVGGVGLVGVAVPPPPHAASTAIRRNVRRVRMGRC
jgi:hypothetical protein